VTLSLQLGFYATPIIYPSTTVPESFQTLYHLNPMAGIIESYRAVVLEGLGPSPYLPLSAIISTAVFFVGYWFFKRVEFQFADVV
jgi:lipopolysaccharide transport system permease protein